MEWEPHPGNWPLSAREPERPQDSLGLPLPEGAADPRHLFAHHFWHPRRFSDSFPALTHRNLFPDSPPNNLDISRPPAVNTPRPPPQLPDSPNLLPIPSSSTANTTSNHAPPYCSTPPSVHISISRPSNPQPTPNHKPISHIQLPTPFFHWAGYTPHVITPKCPLAFPTNRREALVDVMTRIEGKDKKLIAVKTAGEMAKKRSTGMSYFLANAPRELLIPFSGAAGSKSGEGEKLKGEAEEEGGRGEGGMGRLPGTRALHLLESELFDTGKFTSSHSNHLTVLSWSSDTPYGSITLFEADLVVPPSHPFLLDPSGSGLASRRRCTPAISTTAKRIVKGLRPLAAMEDVPRQVLVNMRVDGGLRKVVLQHDGRDANRFRWTSQHVRQMPRYARAVVSEMDLGVPVVRSAVEAGFGFSDDEEEEVESVDMEMANNRRSGRRGLRKPGTLMKERGLLRGGDDLAVGAIPVERAGVVATVPQFLALLHASRSVVETASSAAMTMRKIKTEEGHRVRAVTLTEIPKGKRHTGRDVHAVVLVPDGAAWAEERIFWTDNADGLVELRERKFRDVVEKGLGRTRGAPKRRRTFDRDWGLRSLSPPLTPKSTRW